MCHVGIEGCPDAFQGRDQLRDPFEREIFRLHRDNQRVGGGQDVQGEQVERRGAVEHDQVVVVLDRLEGMAQADGAVVGGREFDVGAGQVFRSWKQEERLDGGGEDHLVGGRKAHEDVVDRVAGVVALNAEAGGRIGLGIAINEENFQSLQGQRGTKVNCGRGFAHSTLLIHDADNFPHGFPD